MDGGDLGVRRGGGGAVLEGFFFFLPPLKLNFSPFQPGPWTRDRARDCVWLPTLRLLKSYAKRVRKKGRGGDTWKKSVSPVLPNDLHVRSNGY